MTFALPSRSGLLKKLGVVILGGSPGPRVVVLLATPLAELVAR
jgi:hypothetical protein